MTDASADAGKALVPGPRTDQDLADILNAETRELVPVILPVSRSEHGTVVDATPVVDRVNAGIARFVTSIAYHSGPLPSPDTLRHYEMAVPGAAERIIAMAELEQAHRHRMQETSLKNTVDLTRRGQLFGLIAAIGFMALAGATAIAGYEWAAAIIGSVDLVAVVTVFVLGRRESSPMKRPESDSEDDLDGPDVIGPEN